MDESADPYEVLQIRSDATTREIRSAFRALIGQWHPDVTASPEAHRRSAAIIAAYRALSQPERRSPADRRHQANPPPRGHDRRCGDRRGHPAARTRSPIWRAATLAWALIATTSVGSTVHAEWQASRANDIDWVFRTPD